MKAKLKKEGDCLQKRAKAAPKDEADSVVSHVAVKDSSSSSGDSPLSSCSDAENDDTVRKIKYAAFSWSDNYKENVLD